MSSPWRQINRQIVGAAEIVLQPIVRGQVYGADVIVVDRAEHVVLGDVAESVGRSQRQAGFLRLQRERCCRGFRTHSVLVLSLKRRRKSPGQTSL